MSLVPQVFDDLLNGRDLLGIFVWDIDIEFGLQQQHELDQGERVGSQVAPEIGTRCHPPHTRVEFLSDDSENRAFYVAYRAHHRPSLKQPWGDCINKDQL